MEKEKLLTANQLRLLERNNMVCEEFKRLATIYRPVVTSWGICKLVELSTDVPRGTVANITKKAGLY